MTDPVNVTGWPVTAVVVLAARLTSAETRSNTVRLWIWWIPCSRTNQLRLVITTSSARVNS